MRDFFWVSSIRKTTIEFLNIFRNIRVAKYDENGNFAQYVTLPIKNANKEKFYYWLKDRKHEKRFPILGVSMAGIELDRNRLANKKYESYFTTSDTTGSKTMKEYYNISPWTITYNVEIVSLYVIEMDQILEQILPYFNPENFVRVNIPEIENTINVKVLMLGATKNGDTTIDMGDYRYVSWSLTFQAQTYLFRPIKDVSMVEEVQTYMFPTMPPSAEYELILTNNEGSKITDGRTQ